MSQTRYPQRAEPWRAVSISKLDSMVNSNSIFNILKSLQNGRYSFIFTTLLVHTTNATIFTKYPFFYFSQFSTPYSSLICSPTTLLFLYLSPTIYTKKILPKSTNPRDQWVTGSLVITETVLISPFLLNIWTVITGLTITDSSLLRLRELVYCRCGKTSNLSSLKPGTYCHYFHTLLITPEELTFPRKSLATRTLGQGLFMYV